MRSHIGGMEEFLRKSDRNLFSKGTGADAIVRSGLIRRWIIQGKKVSSGVTDISEGNSAVCGEDHGVNVIRITERWDNGGPKSRTSAKACRSLKIWMLEGLCAVVQQFWCFQYDIRACFDHGFRSTVNQSNLVNPTHRETTYRERDITFWMFWEKRISWFNNQKTYCLLN